jgi:hypothetical protein
MTVNLVVMVAVTLATVHWAPTRDPGRHTAGVRYAVGGTAVAACLVLFAPWLAGFGLVGLGIFSTAALCALAVFTIAVARTPEHPLARESEAVPH